METMEGVAEFYLHNVGNGGNGNAALGFLNLVSGVRITPGASSRTKSLASGFWGGLPGGHVRPRVVGENNNDWQARLSLCDRKGQPQETAVLFSPQLLEVVRPQSLSVRRAASSFKPVVTFAQMFVVMATSLGLRTSCMTFGHAQLPHCFAGADRGQVGSGRKCPRTCIPEVVRSPG
jgi:hypothetical protein